MRREITNIPLKGYVDKRGKYVSGKDQLHPGLNITNRQYTAIDEKGQRVLRYVPNRKKRRQMDFMSVSGNNRKHTNGRHPSNLIPSKRRG